MRRTSDFKGLISLRSASNTLASAPMHSPMASFKSFWLLGSSIGYHSADTQSGLASRPIWRASPRVRNQYTDADDRVVDVLGKLVADGRANLHVGLAYEVVGGREPAEVGHGLQVPD